jgi:hypothetical protein
MSHVSPLRCLGEGKSHAPETVRRHGHLDPECGLIQLNLPPSRPHEARAVEAAERVAADAGVVPVTVEVPVHERRSRD